MLTGPTSTVTWSPYGTDDALGAKLSRAANAGVAMVIETANANDARLQNNHAYSVREVRLNAAGKPATVALVNPRRKDGGGVGFQDDDGVVEISWADFRRVTTQVLIGASSFA